MKVRELIAYLKTQNPDAEVLVNADCDLRPAVADADTSRVVFSAGGDRWFSRQALRVKDDAPVFSR